MACAVKQSDIRRISHALNNRQRKPDTRKWKKALDGFAKELKKNGTLHQEQVSSIRTIAKLVGITL